MNTNNGGFPFLRLTWKIYLILSQLSCDVSHPSPHSPPSKNSYPVYADYFSGPPGPKEDVVAFANSEATFDCVVILNATGRDVVVHWTKNRVNIDSDPRYQLSQEPSENGTTNFSLTIADVTVQDEGEFGCYIEFSKPGRETLTPVRIDSWPARLRVDINATEPSIVPASQGISIIGQFVVLACGSTGRPCPMISWYDGDNQEIVEEVTNKTEYVSPLYDATSVLLFKIEDYKSKMKCLRCVVRGRSFSAATQKMLLEMSKEIRIKTPEYPQGYPCDFDAGSTMPTTSERIDSNSEISTTSERTDPDSGAEPDSAVSNLSERAGPDSEISATSLRSDPDSGIPTTSERAEPDSAISTTSEPTYSGSAVSTTSERTDLDPTISTTSERANPDSEISATSERTDPDSAISTTSERTDPDSAISTTSERTDPDSAISTTSEWPKNPVVSIGDSLNLLMGIGGTGLLVVLIMTPLLVWYCVMYRHQGSYNVTEPFASGT